MNLTTALNVSIKGTANKAADLSDTTPNTVLLCHLLDELANGTGSDQANQVYADTSTIGAAATVNYDLVASIDDVFGDQMSFTIIKGIIFKNTSTTASVLALGGGTDGAGTTAFDTFIRSAAGAGAGDGSEQILVRPGGVVVLWAPGTTGYACAAGSDNLSIEETSTLEGAFELLVVGVA